MPSNSIKCKKELEPLDNSTSKNISRDEIHNIFTECSLLVKDDFWKQFYEDLALGKPPKGIFLVNGMIQTTNKRNGFSYSITDKAPQVIIKELHYLLLTHTSICSKKDMNKKRQIIDDIRKEFENYDTGKWTRIKRKSMRMMHLVGYALRLRTKYNLDWPETIAAYNTIIGAFDSKTHNSKDIEYVNGKIVDIVDIVSSISPEGKPIIINERSSSGKNTRKVKKSSPTIGKLGQAPIMLRSLFEPYIIAWMKCTNY